MAPWLQVAALIAALVLTYRPLGAYIARTFTSTHHTRVERAVYRMTGVEPDAEQSWSSYATAVIAFSLVSVVGLYLLERLQGTLPLSLGHTGVEPTLAFNTAASFTTNTNWQNYAGEATMGHLVQMAGLAVQNFVSAAVGIAVAIAVVRGFVRHSASTIGNFWVDLVRGCFRLLLPLSFVFAIVLVTQGVVQNLHADTPVRTLEGATQQIPGGPVASQEAIKEIGTNGGGFYNANSAHPFENPTPFTNILEIYLLLMIPFSLPNAFGRMVGSRRQGLVIVGVMGVLWFGSVLLAWHFETQANPGFPPQVAAGNMEGKEVRNGIPASALFATSTTGTSTGSVDASHDSFTPLGGAVPLVNMMLSEITPGGVGSGLYGILILAVLSVFIAGLMVGRTPEYLGKKVEPRDMKLVSLYVLCVPALVLLGAAVAVLIPSARASMSNPGPHGLSEVLYAFTSAANNNGSAFGGLAGDTTFYNISLGLVMLFGRFLPIVFALALAGNMASKRQVPPSVGTFPTDGPLFGGLLVGIIVIVTGLTYFPAVSLGPILEGVLR